MATKKESATVENPKKSAPVEQEADLEQAIRDIKATLDAEPKRSVKLYQVPPGSTDAPLPDLPVQINGYVYQIKRGVSVQVPETVADIIEEAGY